MGAPAGNQFWKLRAKHGRDKIFETPIHLWEAACEYFEWCEENPLIEIDYRGKNLEEVQLPKMRAFTWEGLELFIDIHRLRDYKKNENYKDFSPVIEQIEKIIFNQKFTGAAAGFLNPNIIARDLGLTDKIDQKTEHSGGITIKFEEPDIQYPQDKGSNGELPSLQSGLSDNS